MPNENSMPAVAEEPAPYTRTPFWVGGEARAEQSKVLSGDKSDIESGSYDSQRSGKDEEEALKVVAEDSPTAADPKAQTKRVLAVMEEGKPPGSVSERWQSLPLPLQFLSIVVPMEIVVEMSYAIWLMVLKPAERQYLTAAVLVPAFLTYYVWDAIISDNGFQLLAGMFQCFLTVVVKCIITGITAQNSGGHTAPTEATEYIGYILIGCHVVTLTCAYLSFRQMGWHVYSRLSSDFRKKGADNRKRLWLFQNVFTTLKLLDFQFTVLVLVTTAVVLGQFSIPQGVKAAMSFCCAFGFLLNTAIVVAVRQIVRHEEYRKYMPLVDLANPIGIGVAMLCFILPVTHPGPNGKHQFWGILVTVILFVGARALTWAFMHQLVRLQDEVHDVYAQKLHGRDENEKPHAKIEPLLRGAWLGLPSRFRRNRKCFFQVSQDLSTLRWSWTDYVRLFYVDEIICYDVSMTIRMTMIASSDLLLTFPNLAMYRTWQRGLERLIAELMAPGGAGDRLGSRLSSQHSSAGAASRRSRDSFERRRSLEFSMRRRTSEDGQETTAVTRTTRYLDTFGVRVRTVQDGELEGVMTGFNDEPYIFNISDDEGDETPRKQRSIADVWERLQAQGARVGGGSFSSRNGRSTHSDTARSLSSRSWERTTFTSAPRSNSSDGSGYACIEERKTLIAQDLATLVASGQEEQPGGDLIASVTLDVITLDELKLGRLLGAGAQGEVYAAWWASKPVAVKRFKHLSDSLHELEMHALAGRNRNLVDLKAGCHAAGSIYLVMEYFPRGTLDIMVHHSAKGPWDYVKLCSSVHSIVSGMAFLHAKDPPICHNDLKPGNIFVGRSQGMKIGDFGMARFIGGEDANVPPGRKASSLTAGKAALGTVQYAAPELLNNAIKESQHYGCDNRMLLAVDVYAFGVTLWEVLERKRPHEGVPAHQLQAMGITSPQDLKLPAVKIPDGLPPAEARIAALLAKMADDCCALEPQDRPTFAQLLVCIDRVRAELRAKSGIAANKAAKKLASVHHTSKSAAPTAPATANAADDMV